MLLFNWPWWFPSGRVLSIVNDGVGLTGNIIQDMPRTQTQLIGDGQNPRVIIQLENA